QPAGLLDGFVGSAVVRATSGQRIGVLVNTRNGQGHLSTYAGQPGQLAHHALGNALYFPSLYNDYSALHWSSSLVLQKVDTVAAGVRLQFYDGPGRLLPQEDETLQPGQTRLHYLPADPKVPSGLAGSPTVPPTRG